MTETKGMRIAKFMAAAGLCSRREAERWIEKGYVQVNGKTIHSPALNVTNDDTVRVRGEEIQVKQTRPRIFRLHKPRGFLCTTNDPEGRKTIFELLPAGLPRLVYVGRLDMTSEGLLLLTDSPKLAEALTNPKAGIERTYRVRIDGFIGADQIERLQKGMTVDGIKYRPMKVSIEGEKAGRNNWITLTLTEGKNREIRRVLEALGLRVSRLQRQSFGLFDSSGLPRGAVDEVPGKVIESLLKKMKVEV